MEYTNIYNMKKPETGDALVPEAYNENYDTIDNLLDTFERTNIKKSALSKAIFDAMHPVGSIYISTQSTDPATLGTGTWERIEDTFLMCEDAVHALGSTGGNETVELTAMNMPFHTHRYLPVGEVAEDGAHTHLNGQQHSFGTGINVYVTSTTVNRLVADSGCVADVTSTTAKQQMNTKTGTTTNAGNNKITVANKDTTEAGSHTHTFTCNPVNSSYVGSGQPINVFPAYIAVYAWVRIS